MDGDVPRSTSYGIYTSQLIRFARLSSHMADFNARNKCLTAKLLQGAISIINCERLSPNVIADTMNWFSKFIVGLKTLLHQGLSEPEFYGDLVYELKKKMKIGLIFLISSEKLSYVTNGYNINIMRQSVCLVFNPFTVNNFASLFNCTPVGRASDSVMAPT